MLGRSCGKEQGRRSVYGREAVTGKEEPAFLQVEAIKEETVPSPVQVINICSQVFFY